MLDHVHFKYKSSRKVGGVSNGITPQIFKNIRDLSGALHFMLRTLQAQALALALN